MKPWTYLTHSFVDAAVNPMVICGREKNINLSPLVDVEKNWTSGDGSCFTSLHLIYAIVDLCHPSLDYLTLLQIAGSIKGYSKYENLSSLLDG